MMNILSGAVRLVVDVRQTVPTPLHVIDHAVTDYVVGARLGAAA